MTRSERAGNPESDLPDRRSGRLPAPSDSSRRPAGLPDSPAHGLPKLEAWAEQGPSRNWSVRRIRIARLIWGAAVPLVLLLPLLLSTRAGNDGDLPLELSLTTGLLAASLMAIVVVAASRIRSITTAFGIERVLLSHRWLGLLAAVMVLAHLALVLADRPGNVMLLSFVHAPPRARAATGATIALLLLCAMALLKRRLRIGYEAWRRLHVGLAATALVLTGLHVYWLNHLIRDQAMRAWFAAVAVVLLVVMTNRWVLRPLRRERGAYLVELIRVESPLTSTLVLRPWHRWQRGLRFCAGQFAWIRVRGQGRLWDEHPFTIASGAHQPRRLEFTIRHVGDFTGAIAALRPGQRVSVDGPYGSFTPDRRPVTRLLLIAGGVGITPMMSILRTLAYRGDRRPVTLLVGARDETDLLFRQELADLSRRLHLTVAETVSQPGPGWDGRTGRVDAGLIALMLPSRRMRAEADVYICGSAPMVGGVLQALADTGVPAERVHTEQFDMV